MIQVFRKFFCALGVPCWRLGSKLHILFLSKLRQWPPASTPLIVIGSSLAGGGGRTQVTKALALEAKKRGLRVLVLSLDFKKLSFYDDAAILKQVSDHKITKNRYQSWHKYASQYDLILSDGGLEDPRLHRAIKINLNRGGGQSWFDLLPLGRHRSLLKDHPEAYIWSWEEDCTMQAELPQNYILDGFPEVEVWSTLGDGKAFCSLLKGANISALINLGGHNPRFSQKLQQKLQKVPQTKVLISEKEAVKWDGADEAVYIVSFKVSFSSRSLEWLFSYCYS